MRLLVKSINRFIVCAVCAALLSATSASAQKADPAHYGALPNVSEVQISPNGRYLALLQTSNATSAVLFYDLEAPEEKPTGVGVGSGNARSIIWANNDTVLLLVSHSSTMPTSSGLKAIEFFRWVSVSKSTQKASVIFDNEPGFYMSEAGTFLGVKSEDNERAIFARYSGRAGRAGPSRIGGGAFIYSLFDVNLKNGRMRRAELGTPDTIDWVVDENGEPVVRIDYEANEQKRKIYARPAGEDRLRPLSDYAELRSDDSVLSFHGLSEKEDVAIVSSNNAYGFGSLYEFNLRTANLGEPIFSNTQYDLSSVTYNPAKARATGARYTDHLPRKKYLSPEDNALQSKLEDALPDAAPIIVSKSDDNARIVVEVIYTDHPKQFFLYDQKARSLTMIAASYEALDGKSAAKKEVFDYTATDGTPIPGYLTVPNGADKRNMPLIVLPHGGPWARDDQSFDWWSFFYAARGYLVYQPNFRGSSGYGMRFRMAGNGEWGRKMQSDITEGVQKLIADGVVDPERVCIVGSSYGGYAALAGATLTPDLYQCTVSVNGISNVLQLLADGSGGSGDNDYWKKRIGSRFSDEDSLKAVSPMYAITRDMPPTMLIHSEEDVVVPIGQSRRMRNALEENRIPHEFIVLKDEDHWLSTGEMRTKMLAESIRFIDQHIGQ